jgi:hypothetical protein
VGTALLVQELQDGLLRSTTVVVNRSSSSRRQELIPSASVSCAWSGGGRTDLESRESGYTVTLRDDPVVLVVGIEVSDLALFLTLR